ncbi:unnamed protein product [Nezara viridula]|uniref:DRBM domain-containing protein n=1 Tax=Nezara viridula TaxID=85310 RepID=A0A9P0HM43_NEZVI|nr:unnamed protein product [Nezara viridula]
MLEETPCLGCGSSSIAYGGFDLAPFRLPHWEGNHKPKCRRPRSSSYFPLDPRKHPVTVLYEYCSMQSIIPTFEFYEIPQTVGIEYGCIATVENFIGEGRAFSKKTAKHQAAINVMRKLSRPNYLGDNDLGPRRFVSETGIVSVHYESIPKKRSCFRDRPRMTPPPFLKRAKKKVKWQDSSEGETEDESTRSSFEDLSCSDTVDSNVKVTMNCEDEAEGENVPSQKILKVETDSENNSDSEYKEGEGRFKGSPSSAPVVKPVKENNNNNSGGDQDLIEEISEYLSERLRRTSIDMTDETQQVNQDSSSDEIKVVELNDVTSKRKKKRKRPIGMLTDGMQTLGRKICLKEVNPIGYLQEACMHFCCDPPSYNFYQEGGHIRAVCTLVDSNTEAFGDTQKEAKRAAAVLMIRQLGW